MKIRDYFDSIRIISLATRLDRRRDVVAELGRLGMSLEPGRVEFFDGIRTDSAAGFGTVGLHGCFLSHLEVLRGARAAGLSRILICEDDFQISRRLARFEDAIVDQLRSRPWGLAYFGHIIPTEPGPTPAWVEAAPDLNILLLHCYAVDGSIFDPLIAFLESLLTRPAGHPDGGPMSPDGALSVFRARNPDVTTLILNPSIARQRSSRTDAHDLRWIDRAPIVRDVVGLGRRFKTMIESYR